MRMNDIVVANGGSASVGAFKNQSTPGAFTAASLAARIDFIAGFGPVNLALGDVDGDGKNDLTVSNGGANTFSVFRNLLGEISLPTVTSFTPSFGSAGTSVTINGTNFSTPFTNTVKFNGVSATITASTATSITVDVPAGVTTGLIEVTIGCNAINSSTNFVVCSPPSAPVAIHNSGCSGTSILLGATGGSPGLYLWYSVSTGGTAIPGAVNDSFTTPTLTNNASYHSRWSLRKLPYRSNRNGNSLAISTQRYSCKSCLSGVRCYTNCKWRNRWTIPMVRWRCPYFG